MYRRKNFLFFSIILLLVFMLTTNVLIYRLPKESEINASVEGRIYNELKNLPLYYKETPEISDNILRVLNGSKKYASYSQEQIRDLWKIANSWPNKTQLVDIYNPYLTDILTLLGNAKIIRSDLDKRGTQLKLLLTLEGNQKVIFKPKWYEIDKVLEGPVYVGKDRYNSEIIGFYLSLILKKPLAALSVIRQISLRDDIIAVATKKLLDTTFLKNNRTCIYGKCFFCSISDPICDGMDHKLEGAVIFNLNINLVNHRSPWQRTYKKERNAIWQESSDTYCNSVKTRLSKKRLYDLIDVSVFDFLIQNGDRHHYETFDDTVVWLDNGKGLGNPYKHHLDILAPLYQCCMMRKSMYTNLLKLRGGRLGELLKSIPDINKIITNEHLKALDERILLIFATIQYCKKSKS